LCTQGIPLLFINYQQHHLRKNKNPYIQKVNVYSSVVILALCISVSDYEYGQKIAAVVGMLESVLHCANSQEIFILSRNVI